MITVATDFAVAQASALLLRENGQAPAGLGVGGANGTLLSCGNYPLYIGSRGGASTFLNGNFYGLIIRGALSTDPQITSAERFMNSKTGAF